MRANQGLFVNKELRKAIMTRSRLKNRSNRVKTDEAKSAYKRQRNYCTNLLRKNKIDYFKSLHPSSLTDNKTFWKAVKPAFTDKVCCNESITLVDKEDIISDDDEVARIFNNFFISAVRDLDINVNADFLTNIEGIDDDIDKACTKYQNHPSILRIKKSVIHETPFAFKFICLQDMIKEINAIKPSKATPIDSVPLRILKDNPNLAFILFNNFNNSIMTGSFPDKLKLADVSPIYKKGGRNEKFNYRPVSILPVVSKIYERFMFSQINKFMDSKLSKFQCGFRKGYNTQHCLVRMLEKWKKCIDRKGSCGALLTDLSKAFDCLSHELLIAKRTWV